MKKINNKGYMLVEIILAFSITFILIYFIMDLVIKSKNKNDDLMVETLVKTDQTIITNKLMSYAIAETDRFDCNSLKNNITNSTVKYDGKTIDIVSKYAKIDKSNVSCSTDLGKVSIKIPIKVDQMKNENFDVIIDYKYAIGDIIAPTCSLSVSGTTITATYSDNEGGSGIEYYGWNETKTGDKSNTKTINSVGTYTFYVVDKAKNENKCLVNVQGTVYNTVNNQTSIDANQYWVTTYSGPCNCRGASTGSGYPAAVGDCTRYGGSCSCPSGMWAQDNNCYASGREFSNYYCDEGYSLSGSKCIKTTTSTVIECNTGYNKINDSFCYKIG